MGAQKADCITFGKADYAQILIRAAAKERAEMKTIPLDDEIDILIATDWRR